MSIGLLAGVLFGAFVLAESGSWVGAVAALLVLGPFYGIRAARRMGRAWPGARDLAPADRTAVVRATRRGEDIGDARLAPAVIDYCDGLRKAREQDRLFPLVVLLLTGLAVALAVIDTLSGSTRQAWVSWLFVLFFLVELTWWPRKQAQLMSHAERAERSARRALQQRNSPDE
ncbi:hypothetical protein AQI88_14125 [Streptomyces cellostaticus]|uniref:Uncharacterized protein n=1 Tax=Streptomyces cellostaticus TaxID=67285 RepID=A0A117PWJ7_9ACTN|nr:hypothetical protein [Streptomyces cellostaticus]KUM95990.1 hypothetical protein AQI88_14125 [Streptomyces cellostaticus]